MDKNAKSPATGFILLGLSVLLAVAVKTFAAPCGPGEDGMFMSCHWAGQAVFGISLALIAMSVLRVLIRERGIRAGISISLAIAALAACAMPGILINLCMMETMRCHAVMRPAVLVVAGLAAVVAVADALLCLRRSKES